MNMSNITACLLDSNPVQKLKQFNPRKYCSSQKKMGSYKKLVSKLGNPKEDI